MECKHENVFNYDGTIQWCRDCGSFKGKNYVSWMQPTYHFIKPPNELMKNRDTKDGKVD